jgi:hypothetical protein
MNTHDSLYTPPAGRGYSADDLQREQLKQIDKIFEEQLPALVASGTQIFIEELRQNERMKAFEAQMRASLSPEHMVRAREVLQRRAEEAIKAEAVTAKAAAEAVKEPAPSATAANAIAQQEKRTAPGRR